MCEPSALISPNSEKNIKQPVIISPLHSIYIEVIGTSPENVLEDMMKAIAEYIGCGVAELSFTEKDPPFWRKCLDPSYWISKNGVDLTPFRVDEWRPEIAQVVWPNVPKGVQVFHAKVIKKQIIKVAKIINVKNNNPIKSFRDFVPK